MTAISGRFYRMTEYYIALDKAVKYLNKLLRSKTIKSVAEINDIKAVREKLNSMMYEVMKK